MTTATSFNPFTDRLSRDLRNDLSEAFAKAVESGDPTELEQTLSGYQNRQLTGFYQTYFAERQRRYRHALETIGQEDRSPLARGVVLWNLELFFEVHEVLEHAWYDAEGELKATLQAMIRAAGVYIKRESGLFAAADKIAAKAIPVLERNSALLAPFFSVSPLIAALADRQAPPPKLC